MIQNGNKLKTEHRLSTLEANYNSLNEKVDRIENNHLVHLQAGLDKVQDKIDKGTWLAITVLVGVIVTLGTLWLK